jgi:hypothetical protein
MENPLAVVFVEDSLTVASRSTLALRFSESFRFSLGS